MSRSRLRPHRAIRPRKVRTRRIAFEYPVADIPRHFVHGDLVMSHVVAVLSSVFPEGEDFFVRSVRNYRDQITDPELKEQVGGFIGQEAMHGREHRAFNERLKALGYPTRAIDRFVAVTMTTFEKVLPKSYQLAITAALEHYTATLAEVLLVDDEFRALLDVEEIQSLFVWHALEESEHKSVAFDVFEEVIGSHRVRAWVMNFTTVLFLGAVGMWTVISMLLDRASYNPRRLFRSLAEVRHSPWLTREVRHRIRDYNRKGFHPEDNDNTEIVERWRAELFGSDGRLVERLKTTEAQPA